MSALVRAVGQSGRRYVVERILQEKPMPLDLGRVYLATSADQKYVLKSVQPKSFQYFQNMLDDIRTSPYSHYVRVSDDSIPDKSMFVDKYLKDHLLGFVQKDNPLPVTKRILRDALRGIAATHDKGIVHTDIKANNIMVEWNEKSGEVVVEQVQVADVEDAAYVPDDCVIEGRQVGNWMWRSPEAHASGQVHKPSDIFSFGVVCIYALTKRVIFAVGDDELNEGEDKLAIVLERQISYFCDPEGFGGLLKHLGESPWVQIFTVIAEGFNEENSRLPFAQWSIVEPEARDLIGRMMNMDPNRRLTAHEALAHPWFADVP
ncbi:kinase-like protein [Mytilinidion resinicola]|uniref:Kinase-like protein n=1 Tax=Mytilinidion resinicola TaxID=574789 RepID=A0A6A6Z4D0_9PEZI|nr:kinase-like protein [Mytilinidion resinicola]KAF2815025.1 kinase-like protein [Mytilinidion resinicola]